MRPAQSTITSPFNFFMGVSLPAGKHSVVFQYKPSYFYIFAAISIAFTILIVILLSTWCKHKINLEELR
jgi:uncharacterized membrane protein YfhO